MMRKPGKEHVKDFDELDKAASLSGFIPPARRLCRVILRRTLGSEWYLYADEEGFERAVSLLGEYFKRVYWRGRSEMSPRKRMDMRWQKWVKSGYEDHYKEPDTRPEDFNEPLIEEQDG